MGERLDEEIVTGTLAAGETLTAEIRTSGQADDVFVQIDDQADGTPAGYSLRADAYSESADAYFFFAQEGSSGTPATARSWTDPATPDRLRYTLTNQSGVAADYRMRVVSSR